MIFKKELEEEFQILNNHFLRKQQQIQCEMEKNKKKYGIVERIFYLFPNAEIIGMEKNKKDDELFIVMNNDTIYLLGERYQGITNLPRILFHVYKTDDEFFQKRKNRGRITCMAQAYRHYLGDLKRAWLYHGLHHPVLCRRKMERIDERRCHYGNT